MRVPLPLCWAGAALPLLLGCGQEISVFDGGFRVTSAVGGVFSEIAFESAANASDEFVELYNPGSEPVPLGGCEVQYDGASSGVNWLSFHLFPASGGPAIAARGYFLIAGMGYSGPPVDAPRSNNNITMGVAGSLRLLCGEDVVDQVAWGGGRRTGGDERARAGR